MCKSKFNNGQEWKSDKVLDKLKQHIAVRIFY